LAGKYQSKKNGRGYEQGINLTNTLAATTPTPTPSTTTFIYKNR